MAATLNRQHRILTERLTAQMDDGFVVFLIGMRINRPWKIHKWIPVVAAMPRMVKELSSKPELGFLGYEAWFGRTTLMLQYWRSADQLLAYAKSRDAQHLPAWRAFNKAVGTSGDVGVWHETYVVAPGACESVYVNMPPFGLGKVGQLLAASGKRESAKDRFVSKDRINPTYDLPRDDPAEDFGLSEKTNQLVGDIVEPKGPA